MTTIDTTANPAQLVVLKFDVTLPIFFKKNKTVQKVDEIQKTITDL